MSKINDLIGSLRKNNHAARAARFLVQLVDVAYQLERRCETFILEVLTTT